MLRAGTIAGLPSCSLADSIRALCAEVIAMRNPNETELVLAELRAAIEEYISMLYGNLGLEESAQTRFANDHPPMVI